MSTTEAPNETESGIVSTTIKRLAGINGLLGLWMIAAPFVWGAPPADLRNDVVVGVLIAGIAGYNYYREINDLSASRGSAAMNTVLGLWLILVPSTLGSTGVLFWNDVVVGAVITLLAGYNWGVGGFGTTT